MPPASKVAAPSLRIAVVGAGVVGGALRAWFASAGIEAAAYDPPKGLSDASVLDVADIVFVCVPTPYLSGEGVDLSYVVSALEAIPGERLVVLKSTVLPGTTEALQQRFPQHRIAFNPEFLRESTAVDDMMRPDRQIVGYTPRSLPDAGMLLELLPPAPRTVVCAARDAEMAKYMANSLLALKVSFANEIHGLCEKLGVEYGVVRDIVAADTRIGPSHLDVFDGGYRGYGGACLPKDTRALLDLAERVYAPIRTLRAAHDVNQRLRVDASSGDLEPVKRAGAGRRRGATSATIRRRRTRDDSPAPQDAYAGATSRTAA
jgi:UDPglucose 6-dehydrogenase